MWFVLGAALLSAVGIYSWHYEMFVCLVRAKTHLASLFTADSSPDLWLIASVLEDGGGNWRVASQYQSNVPSGRGDIRWAYSNVRLRRTTDSQGSPAYVPYLLPTTETPVKTDMPFFQAVFKRSDTHASVEDITPLLKQHAYVGNRIGGKPFWVWFFRHHCDVDLSSVLNADADAAIMVLDRSFVERVLDLDDVVQL